MDRPLPQQKIQSNNSQQFPIWGDLASSQSSPKKKRLLRRFLTS
jgi:hypothetical protein